MAHEPTLEVGAEVISSLSDGEIWTTHRGVNPCGLVVQRGDLELRTRWLC
jgi:hypothetical protein